MRKIFFQATAAIATVIISTSAMAADFQSKLVKPGTLVIGTSPGGSGTIVSGSGEVEGFDVDYGKKLATDMGLKPEVVVIDWPGLLPGLIAGRFDVAISGIVKSEKRLAAGDFIMTNNYAIDGIGLLKRADDSSITGWDTICGKRIGLNRGAAENAIAASTLPSGCISKSTEYPTWAENVLDLKSNRTDVIINSYIAAGYYSKQDSSVAIAGEVRSPYPYAAAVSKNNPELAKKIDELTHQYVTDGTLNTIMTKYGVTIDWATMEGVKPASK